MQAKKQYSQPQAKRQAYLVRCWQEIDGNWRYTVEPVDGRSLPRRGFTELADLLAYLQTVIPGNTPA